jgi:hypothetical protein
MEKISLQHCGIKKRMAKNITISDVCHQHQNKTVKTHERICKNNDVKRRG